MQDYIAMVMIWYATEMATAGNPQAEKEWMGALEKMEQQIDKVL